MLINKEEIAKKVLDGEICDIESLNVVLPSVIKEVVETAMLAELTDFLGCGKNHSPDTDTHNRRNDYIKRNWPRNSAQFP